MAILAKLVLVSFAVIFRPYTLDARPIMKNLPPILNPSWILNRFQTCTVFQVIYSETSDIIDQRNIAQPTVLKNVKTIDMSEPHDTSIGNRRSENQEAPFFGLKYNTCSVVMGTAWGFQDVAVFKSMTQMNRKKPRLLVDIHPEFHIYLLPTDLFDDVIENPSEQHVPITFLLGFERQRLVDPITAKLGSSYYTITSGRYFCMSCNKFRDKSLYYEDFTCYSDSHQETCYGSMMQAFERVTNHGKNISWATNVYLPFRGFVDGYSVGQGVSDPFNRFSPLPIAETILSNLFPDTDFVTGMRTRNFKYMHTKGPSFFRFAPQGSPEIALWFDSLILDRQPLHYMITSEQIDESQVSASMFTSPFPLLVWRSLAASLVVTTALLTILLNRVRPCYFLHTLCKLLESLVDQWSLKPRTDRSIRGGLTKLTLLAWLLLSFFFTNLYRTFWSVEFVAPFPRMTKMENLTEFLNFDIYVVTGEFPWEHSCVSAELSVDEWFVHSFLGRSEEAAPICDLEHEYMPCSFLERLLKTRVLFHHGNQDLTSLLREDQLTHAKTFANMYCNVQAVCEEHLLELIVTNQARKAYLPKVYRPYLDERDYLRKENSDLCNGKPLSSSEEDEETSLKPCYCDEEIGSGNRPIAFVASEYEFDWLWNKFKLLMKEKKLPNNMRFASTKHHQDMSYVAGTGYGITRGLHPMFQRPKTILHRYFDMGIYQLWKKWDWIRFSLYRLRDNQVVPDRNADFQSLTLLSSHLILVFYGLGMLLAVSMVFFIIEAVWKGLQAADWRDCLKKART